MSAPDVGVAGELLRQAFGPAGCQLTTHGPGGFGRAASPSTLWLLLVDGDDRQTPVVTPIDGAPPWPDGFVDGLARVVAGIAPDLATPNGPGSVIFVRERLGSRHVTDQDQAWAQALASMCRRVGVVLRGVYGCTPLGVRRLG